MKAVIQLFFKSIYGKMLLAVIIGAVAAAALFLSLDYLGNYMVDTHFASQKVDDRLDKKYAAKLQEYAVENQVRSDDRKALDAWVKKHDLIYIRVYHGKKIVYDSAASLKDTSEEGETASFSGTRTIQFTDGPAQVYLEGFYYYAMYSFAFLVALAAAFILFLIILMSQVRKWMKRIRQLHDDVRILESGNLEYEVGGGDRGSQDEITELSREVNAMRSSLKDQFENERELQTASQEMIKEMSHDLRTPLTSIMLYAELLKKRSYKDESEMFGYIDRIDAKARQMKTQTDNLFEYALIGINESAPLIKENFRDVFYDQLSAMCGYLEHMGYQTAVDLTGEEATVVICPDYIPRIFDNLVSNILKYADPGTPVHVVAEIQDRCCRIAISNAVKEGARKRDGGRVGLINIRKMMKAMKGSSRIVYDRRLFAVDLSFLRVK